MLVSLYYLTLWYPLPKLQPKGKTKEPKDDIHDSEHTLLKPKHEAAAAPPRPAQPRPDRLRATQPSPAQTSSSQPGSEVKRDEAPRPCIKRNNVRLMRQSRCLTQGDSHERWNLPSARVRSCVKDGRAPGRRPTRGGSWVPQILSLAAERNARLFLPYRYGWRQLPRGLGAKTIRFRGPPK